MRQRLTSHAQKRMQQRCISDLQIALIETFGEVRYQKGGTQEAFVREDKINEIRRAVDKLSGVCVVSSPNTVITVMHQPRRLRSV